MIRTRLRRWKRCCYRKKKKSTYVPNRANSQQCAISAEEKDIDPISANTWTVGYEGVMNATRWSATLPTNAGNERLPKPLEIGGSKRTRDPRKEVEGMYANLNLMGDGVIICTDLITIHEVIDTGPKDKAVTHVNLIRIKNERLELITEVTRKTRPTTTTDKRLETETKTVTNVKQLVNHFLIKRTMICEAAQVCEWSKLYSNPCQRVDKSEIEL